jgi:hypothetical protein
VLRDERHHLVYIQIGLPGQFDRRDFLAFVREPFDRAYVRLCGLLRKPSFG